MMMNYHQSFRLWWSYDSLFSLLEMRLKALWIRLIDGSSPLFSQGVSPALELYCIALLLYDVAYWLLSIAFSIIFIRLLCAFWVPSPLSFSWRIDPSSVVYCFLIPLGSSKCNILWRHGLDSICDVNNSVHLYPHFSFYDLFPWTPSCPRLAFLSLWPFAFFLISGTSTCGLCHYP